MGIFSSSLTSIHVVCNCRSCIFHFLAANKEATEQRLPFVKIEVITSKIVRSPS